MREVGEGLFKLQKWPRHVLAHVHRGHALLAEATSSSSSVTSHALLHGPLPLPQLIVKHDTARVFQCMLQHGTAQQRSSLFGELEGKSCGGGWGMWKWAGLWWWVGVASLVCCVVQGA